MTNLFQQTQSLSAQELAALPARQLFELQADASETFLSAKKLKDRINDSLELKYKDQASVIRIQQGKDSGTVHFEDDGIEITSELPKKVTWDQKQLAAIAKRIQASGEDPSQYVDVSFRVAERRYSAWPDSIKQAFQSARTFNTGRQTFKLIKGEGK